MYQTTKSSNKFRLTKKGSKGVKSDYYCNHNQTEFKVEKLKFFLSMFLI